MGCDYNDICDRIAVEIRELIANEASDVMLGAMVGEPGECFGFAREWIKKQKGLPYRTEWFKNRCNKETSKE
jgi:hypothetical protein